MSGPFSLPASFLGAQSPPDLPLLGRHSQQQQHAASVPAVMAAAASPPLLPTAEGPPVAAAVAEASGAEAPSPAPPERTSLKRPLEETEAGSAQLAPADSDGAATAEPTHAPAATAEESSDEGTVGAPSKRARLESDAPSA